MANEIKTNLDYIRLVEHWQTTDSQREKKVISAAIIKSVSIILLDTCNKFSNRGNRSMEDLMQEAYIGVLKSLEKWDTQKAGDSKYTSYMMLWVKGQLYNYVSKDCGDVRVPKNNIEKVLKDVKENGEVSEKNLKYTTSYVYLDKPRPDGEEIDSILYSQYQIYSLNPAIEKIKSRDEVIVANKAYSYIKDPILKEVLYKRSHGMTLETIGLSMSLTRERIRQLETRALSLLRSNKNLMGDIKEWLY